MIAIMSHGVRDITVCSGENQLHLNFQSLTRVGDLKIDTFDR